MTPIIVTTTFYLSREDVRFQFALQTLEAAREQALKVIVVDGSPLPWAQEAFEARGAVVLREAPKGMGAARRQALQAALDDPDKADVFVWMEPEKAPLVPLLRTGLRIIADSAMGMILPRRKSLDSYPQYQQYCELRGNWAVGNFTHRPDLDFWFGPRIMDRRAAQFFLEYEGDYGDRWDSIFIPVVRAIASVNKCPVVSMVMDYIHPAEQTAAETGDEAMDRKRDQQLAELIEAVRQECVKLHFPLP